MTCSPRGRATERAPYFALACFAAAVLLILAGSARSAPAMWKVSDADSTIHLFGTMHFTKPDTAWRSPQVEAVLKASDKLVLEIANLDDQAAAAPLIQQYGLDPQRPLTSKLDDGAGHLVGEEGVPALLKAKGLKVERVAP